MFIIRLDHGLKILHNFLFFDVNLIVTCLTSHRCKTFDGLCFSLGIFRQIAHRLFVYKGYGDHL